MDRHPNRLLVGISPFDAMLFVRRNLHMVAWSHLDGFVLKLKPRGSLHQQHPFVGVLVVPKTFWRGVPLRDDPLNEDAWGLEQDFDKLSGQGGGDRREKVVCGHLQINGTD
jgi:hypothetical protein